MCGIVGVASNGPMNVQMKDFFQDLLFHDIVRGRHATGVAAVDTINRDLAVVKKALPADLFLLDQKAMDELFAPKHNFNIYIGHNRFATQGNKDLDDNAHPFIHGDLVGVHNGTLRDQKLLDDHRDFQVDSDNLYHHMSKNGLDDTLTKLDGAFALVWYDKGNNTLNFLRNEERPLAIALLSNGCWVWASEIGMLRWLVGRHKSLAFATAKEEGVDVVQLWQLEKGTHFSIPFKDKTRQMDKTRASKKTLPTFTRSYGNYGGNWDGGYYRGWENNSSNRVTRVGNHSTSGGVVTRSPYLLKGDAAVAKWLPGGDQNSWLELEFAGHVKPVSKTGYQQNLSLYKYRNTAGQTVLLFAYNHAGNMTAKWTEADVGKRFFAQISTANEVTSATYDVTVTPGYDFVFTVTNISVNRPPAFFSYCDGEPTMEVNEKGEWKAKGKGGSSGRVVPFPKTKKEKKERNRSASRSLRSATSNPGVCTEDGKVMLIIGNEIISKTRLEEYVLENHGMCANCAGPLEDRRLDSIFLHEWFDRESGETKNFLSCRQECHDDMEQVTGEFDELYEKLLGNK